MDMSPGFSIFCLSLNILGQFRKSRVISRLHDRDLAVTGTQRTSEFSEKIFVNPKKLRRLFQKPH